MSGPDTRESLPPKRGRKKIYLQIRSASRRPALLSTERRPVPRHRRRRLDRKSAYFHAREPHGRENRSADRGFTPLVWTISFWFARSTRRRAPVRSSHAERGNQEKSWTN